MLSKKSIVIKAICLLMAMFVVVGCTNSKGDTQSSKQNEDTITLAWPRDVGEMNPHMYNPSQLFAQSMVYEPLISYREGGKPKPHLAKSWEISEDGKRYTFKLRDDVKFSDGTKFNAQIVKKNFDSILMHKEIHNWLGLITKIIDTKVVDEYTFELVLSEPYYPTIQELAVVRPVRFLAEAGFPKDNDTSKGVLEEIGTGPWVLDEYKTDEYATFKVNEDYWGELPKAKKIHVKIIPDAETRVLAFEKGEVDLIYGEGVISIDAFNQLKSTDKYKTTISEPVATRLLIFNTKKEQLSDERVRRALHYGFDKKVMVDGITSGLEEVADFILPPNLPYTSNLNVEQIDYDVKKAKALLAEAGWELPKGKTIREKDGQLLQVEMMYDSAELIQKAMAETLQSEWAEIGVDLKIVGVEKPNQVQRFKENNFDINMYSNFGAPYDPHTFVNIIGTEGFGFIEAIAAYPNKEDLLKEMQSVLQTTNEEERQKAYSKILPSLQDQGAFLPISYLKVVAIYQNNVTDFSFSANRDESPFAKIGIE